MLTACGSSGVQTADGVVLLTADAPSGSDVSRTFELVGVDGDCVTARLVEEDAAAAVLVAPEGTRLEIEDGNPVLRLDGDRRVVVGEEVEVGGGYGQRTDDPDAADFRPIMDMVGEECGAERYLLVHDW